MTNFAKLTMAVFAAAFLTSSPVIAADATTQTATDTAKTITDTTKAATPAKPDLAGGLKQKAGDIIEQGKTKVDNAAKKLEDSLGLNKAKDAKAAADKTVQDAKQTGDKATKAASDAKQEVLDVQQETTTITTPQGTASETTTVITPETPAKK